MSKPSVVYFGTPQFSGYILEQLIDSGKFEIKAVITNPDKPVDRKRVVAASATSAVADKYSIPILKPAKLTQEFIDQNRDLLLADLFIVASYGKIIPQALLDIPNKGAINVHGSLLPKLRGASPIQQAILNGDKETGATIMLMDEQMDHGDILATASLDISDNDTSETMSIKIGQLGARLLIETVQSYLKGSIKPIPQDHSQATFCKLIQKEDGYFDISNPPTFEVLDRMIRAYYPWPNAWTKWNGNVVKFYPDGLIQMEGKKAVSLKDFINGHSDFPIKTLTR